jgi:hypothetical protein
MFESCRVYHLLTVLLSSNLLVRKAEPESSHFLPYAPFLKTYLHITKKGGPGAAFSPSCLTGEVIPPL